MPRSDDRRDASETARLRMIEADADRFEHALTDISHELVLIEARFRAAQQEAKEDTDAKLNKILFAILGLTLTIIGGLAVAVLLGLGGHG